MDLASRTSSSLWSLVGLLCCSPKLLAQDPFEIHIYEYEPLKWKEYSLETHLNLVGQGSPEADGTLLPTRHQTHLTLEPTFGLAKNFALGFMYLNAWEPGYSPQYAGWRVLPHFYAPESWRLPFRLGLVAEFSFQNTRYEENSRRVELRPILDREFTRWQFVLNPVFERALRGPGMAHGWNFEPAALIRWKRPVFAPSVEYFGQATEHTHQLFLGGDWQVTPLFRINLGFGFDLGSHGPGLVLKSRFEWDWTRKPL